MTALPAIVDGHVAHHRYGPVAHRFRHRAYQWLVDLDAVPHLPRPLRWFASFDARDHFGGTGTTASTDIKANVERFLAGHGIGLGRDSRIVMLANARVLGHVFDPLSVFWCHDRDGTLRCIVAEVHNTFGERHAYVLEPDARGKARVEKAFYVSPFYRVEGTYTLRFRLDAERVAVTVGLDQGGRHCFDASFVGRPEPATHRAVARYAWRQPLMPLRVAALIRWHGLRLWLRGLPIVPRLRHLTPKGV